MYKVIVNQFGRTHKVYIDGCRITLEKLIKRINVTPGRLRQVLNTSKREQAVLDWLLKADAGVHSNSKVHWRGEEFQITEVVAKKVGLSNSAAWSRIITWLDTGDENLLLRRKYL